MENKRKVFWVSILFLVSGCLSVRASILPVYNVRDFGAEGSGIKIDSDAINKAIEAAAENGGGTVYFPAGTYLSFSIRLKSHIRLFFEKGSTLLAADPADFPGLGYDLAEPNVWNDSVEYQDFGHSHWKNSLIWGIGLEDITIEGSGLIDGKGLVRTGRRTPGLGNKAIAMKLCRNVCIRDIRIFRGGHFGILPTGVDNFTIDNVMIDSNRDGINIDCCRNVRISNCLINTPNDDAIVLKSSYALGFARVTEQVSITNCQVSGFDLGTLLDGTFQTTQQQAPDKGGVTGRIKFGTESNGGFKNICISNCTFTHCRGLAFESVDGAVIEDVVVSNITMRDITDSGLFIRLGSRMRGPDSASPGKFDRILLSNISIEGVPPRYCIMIMGIPGHPVEGIALDNIKLKVKGGAVPGQSEAQVPENENSYPDPMNFGNLPAYGLYIRHAANIHFNQIGIKLETPDTRPAIILDDVQRVTFSKMAVDRLSGGPVMILNQVNLLKIDNFDGVRNERIQKTDFRIIR